MVGFQPLQLHLLVHHFGPDGNISTTIGWIAMKFCAENIIGFISGRFWSFIKYKECFSINRHHKLLIKNRNLLLTAPIYECLSLYV